MSYDILPPDVTDCYSVPELLDIITRLQTELEALKREHAHLRHWVQDVVNQWHDGLPVFAAVELLEEVLA